ncbi:LysR family transcriptional regulator [Cupriavidus sp. CV2]|uniref:LysR family transcriptional regulator n=1 Tax=Cupriavidus ulmosensis TaxID=3065913 RepID=UPI00296B133B|nr:LysR family transcriptional regulator [Cupriavidus sp. CV2]MDW3685448.1 LysR family transcriptional regulator [Cupriavidus sp. CV2]
MDINFLQTFIVVVDAGSIAEAARRLDLAPTTVAQQIKALEADIGSKLLARSGRTVRPTIAGSRILERARLVVREVGNLRSEASDTALPAGPLRLGCAPTALMGLLPSALREWKRRYPGIEIFIEPGTSVALMAKVVSGELDAAVLVHPAFAMPKTCEWVPLRNESLILLTPARMKVTDPLQTIAREPFIRYDRNVVAGKQADDYLHRHNLRPQVQFELDGIEHIAKLVAEGLGVSVLPDWAPGGQQDARVRRWALPAPRPQRTVGMVWLRGSVRSPLAAALAALLDTSLPAPAAA